MNQEAETHAQKILYRVREQSSAKFPAARLPRWVRAAKISIGCISNTAIICFEDSTYEYDEFAHHGEITSDGELYFGHFGQTSASAQFLIDFPGPDCKLIFSYGDPSEAPPVITLSNPQSLAVPMRSIEHGTLIVADMKLVLVGSNPSSIVLATRYLPLSMYVHRKYLAEEPRKDVIDEILYVLENFCDVRGK